MVRGVAILFLLGAAVYAVVRLDALVRDPAVQAEFRARVSDGAAQAPGSGHSRRVRVAADRRGHFVVDARVNGRRLRMVVDTGASAVVLTQDDARRAGIDVRSLTYDLPVKTANGETSVARVTLERMDVEGIRLSDVRAVVAQDGAPDGAPDGALESNLLGMTFLNRLASVKMSGDTLELVE